uniref:Protein FAR1-RELATED SEQUENCE n=1 Tax=Lactuca sativa TaxID=4236 RepID=A0A9R1WAM3_LACSA|nr:hypothetical protein LSAT_V11C200052210 [Lactuca sativa]
MNGRGTKSNINVSMSINARSRDTVIKKTLKTLVYESTDTQEFEDWWCKLVEKYTLEKNEWFSSLFNDRRRWVPIYVKDNFWAGMSTTQRSESMNSSFDVYVNSKTSLRQFVEQYDNALKSKIEKETKPDFESLNSSYKLVTGCTRMQFLSCFKMSYEVRCFAILHWKKWMVHDMYFMSHMF